MGMFNWVDFEDVCLCGEELSNFQTKDDTNNELLCEHVKPESVEEFYVPCDACQRWYDYKTSKDKTKVVRVCTETSTDLRELTLAASDKE